MSPISRPGASRPGMITQARRGVIGTCVPLTKARAGASSGLETPRSSDRLGGVSPPPGHPRRVALAGGGQRGPAQHPKASVIVSPEDKELPLGVFCKQAPPSLSPYLLGSNILLFILISSSLPPYSSCFCSLMFVCYISSILLPLNSLPLASFYLASSFPASSR